jgi:hypothetical protein
MNLVIDDAVEVKLASKTNPEEKRKPLGTYNPTTQVSRRSTDSPRRPDPTKRRQCVPDTEPVRLRKL